MTDARERVNRDHYDNEYVVTDARERLKRVIADALNDGWQHEAGRLAEKLLAAGVTLAPDPPAPLKVWPGMEGDGLRRVLEVFDTAYEDAVRDGKRDVSRAARTAQAAYLWRALVASLPEARKGDGIPGTENIVRVGGNAVYRDDLAALADPYDGGGK